MFLVFQPMMLTRDATKVLASTFFRFYVSKILSHQATKVLRFYSMKIVRFEPVNISIL